MVQTSETLKSKESEVKATQEIVKIQKNWLDKHQENETALHDKASTLLTTLENTISDVEGLHSKLGIC